jgi:hypothetical protein
MPIARPTTRRSGCSPTSRSSCAVPADAAKRDAWPCKGVRLGAGATVTIAWLGREITARSTKVASLATKPNREMATWLLRFCKAMRRIDELRALVPSSLAPTCSTRA